MQPHAFVSKWRHVELKERTASQSHFNDLCALLGVLDPIAADPAGEWFTFEKGATKTGGGEGWADVWRRGCFAWEYKGRHANLDKAFAQLLQYAVALENPPLLITSDTDRIRLYTNWTNTVQERREWVLDDLLDGAERDALKRAFTDPDHFRPAKTRAALTEETAREFAGLAQRLRGRGHPGPEVAHFVNRLVFCMFAEDVGLLPESLFTRMLELSRRDPAGFADNARTLFGAMARRGGKVGFTPIDWFNGGLFEDEAALPVTADDIDDLLVAARRDWSQVDPSILGTLFERGLDPAKRSQLGAHYTDRAKIEMIVRPVIVEPLEEEWAEALARMTALVDGAPRRTAERLLSPAERRRGERLREEAAAIHRAFVDRLAAFRVLDPACGSGNFLYVALRALKDIEHRANLDAEALGLPRGFPRVGPECVLGIELNPYAAELARVSVWIGEIQWMRRNGFDAARDPILRPLDTIACRDAVLAGGGRADPPQLAGEGDRPAKPGGGGALASSESPGAAAPPPPPSAAVPLPTAWGGLEGPTRAEWPDADVVVGNPPFLGNKKMIRELGEGYTAAPRRAWPEVPGGADLVCYWFAKAWAMVASGRVGRAGLVATNSIRGGANRAVLKPIVEGGRIFRAWSDEAWTVEGAAVRVSLVCFDGGEGSGIPAQGRGDGGEKAASLAASRHPGLAPGSRFAAGGAVLDEQIVPCIRADLSAGSGETDLTKAGRLSANLGRSFIGRQKDGPLNIPGSMARDMIVHGHNPNGRSNADIVRPWRNGLDVTRRSSDDWLIDFMAIEESEAALYEAPFEYARTHLKPLREHNRDAKRRSHWWRPGRTGDDIRAGLAGLPRFLATPRVAKHRLFVWLDQSINPDCQLVVVARDDDTCFGILHSRFHELWALRMGTFLGVGNDPRYTPSTTFETFPFPDGLTPDIPAAAYADLPAARAIAAAAARLNALRENWLNPADLTVREAEVVPGYPDRILPRDEDAAKALKARTLTNLYNQRPHWLRQAHAALDAAVADAYGWGAEHRAGALGDDEVLARLFRLNQARAGVSSLSPQGRGLA